MMRGHWVLCLLTLVAVVVGVHALERGELEQLPHGAKLLASFLRVEYDWDGAPAGAEEMFRFDNCAITGVKWYNDELYLTVPRWRPGVPSTLNKLVSKNGVQLLQAFPSWDWQTIGNYSALQYVQSMEIDSQGRMWILDAGRINFFSENPADVVNGPPKLVVWDLNTNSLVRQYVFSNEVASYDGSFLNDIVVDEVHGFAYISDSCNDGGIVVYSWDQNTAWRWVDPSMRPTVFNFTINGYTFAVTTPSDGIALTPDTQRLFYSPLASVNLYSVPTSVLRTQGASYSERHAQVVNHGDKMSGSDGMAFDAAGRLFFGVFDQKIFVNDAVGMQWVDTLAFDSSDHLIFTTNRLQLYFNNKMNFTQGASDNFRVWQVSIDSDSYLSAEHQDSPKAPKHTQPKTYSESVVIGLSVGVGVLAVALLVVAALFLRAKRANVSPPAAVLVSAESGTQYVKFDG